MARKPSPAPAPATPDAPPSAPPAEAIQIDDVQEENEILAEARRIRDLAAERAKNVDWKSAGAIGIGSAALLAAVLFANRKR